MLITLRLLITFVAVGTLLRVGRFALRCAHALLLICTFCVVTLRYICYAFCALRRYVAFARYVTVVAPRFTRYPVADFTPYRLPRFGYHGLHAHLVTHTRYVCVYTLRFVGRLVCYPLRCLRLVTRILRCGYARGLHPTLIQLPHAHGYARLRLRLRLARYYAFGLPFTFPVGLHTAFTAFCAGLNVPLRALYPSWLIARWTLVRFVTCVAWLLRLDCCYTVDSRCAPRPTHVYPLDYARLRILFCCPLHRGYVGLLRYVYVDCVYTLIYALRGLRLTVCVAPLPRCLITTVTHAFTFCCSSTFTLRVYFTFWLHLRITVYFGLHHQLPAHAFIARFATVHYVYTRARITRDLPVLPALFGYYVYGCTRVWLPSYVYAVRFTHGYVGFTLVAFAAFCWLLALRWITQLDTVWLRVTPQLRCFARTGCVTLQRARL